MTFANPSYLWAFAALAVPLAIHLLSRKEGKVIRVGSIRHVEESNTSQFKSIRLNEIFLLLLRSLMVTSLVLFLSGAQCTSTSTNDTKWLVIEPGVDLANDSLISKGYELHYLNPKNYWASIEELKRLPHEIVVISFSRIEGFNGERISLPQNIKWITADSNPKEFAAVARSAGDTVFIRTGSSNSLSTTYKTSVGVPADSIEIVKLEPVRIGIDGGTKDQLQILTAALDVLRNEYKLPLSITPQQPTIIITFAPTVSVVEKNSPDEIFISSKLDQDIALNENLVIALFKNLYPELKVPEIVRSNDARVLPDEMAFSKTENAGLAPSSSLTGIEKYLIALFILLLAAERFTAIKRNQ